MRAKCKVIVDQTMSDVDVERFDYWIAKATVEHNDFVADITVKMNVDTIVCECKPYPLKTFGWTEGGDVETNAILAAVKYHSWLENL